LSRARAGLRDALRGYIGVEAPPDAPADSEAVARAAEPTDDEKP